MDRTLRHRRFLPAVFCALVTQLSSIAAVAQQPPRRPVSFASTPSAAVFANDELVCLHTPCSANIAEGEATITMVAEDTVPRSERIVIRATTKAVNWPLERYALVTLLCDPMLQTRVDKNERNFYAKNSCPAVDLCMRPGQHTLDVQGAFGRVSATFSVTGGERRFVVPPESRREWAAARFEPTAGSPPGPVPAAPPPRFGVVVLAARDRSGKPVRGQAFVDGTPLGAVPGRYVLPLGLWPLIIERDGYVPWRYRKRLFGGETVTVQADLTTLRMARAQAATQRREDRRRLKGQIRLPPWEGDAYESPDPCEIVMTDWTHSVLAYHPEERRSQPLEDALRAALGPDLAGPSASVEDLEAFLVRQPNDAARTPWALFRLAQVQQDTALAWFRYRTFVYEREAQLYSRGKRLDPPAQPKLELSQAVQTYQRARQPLPSAMPRSPDFPGSAAALHAEAMCEWLTDDWDKAGLALRSLVATAPESMWAAEAWTWLGETRSKQWIFDDAVEHYRNGASVALARGEEATYLYALHRVGITSLRLNRPVEAIRAFVALLDYEAAHKTSLSPAARAVAFHDEAVDRLAAALVEGDWEGDGCDDFGGGDYQPRCWTADRAVRAQLYASSVVAPELPQGLDWSRGADAGSLKTALAAREAVRTLLAAQERAYLPAVLLAAAERLMEDQAPAEVSRIWLEALLARYPLAEEAEEAARALIAVLDAEARQTAALDADSAFVAAANAPMRPQDASTLHAETAIAHAAARARMTERQRYLATFAAGSPWRLKWGADPDVAKRVETALAIFRRGVAAQQ